MIVFSLIYLLKIITEHNKIWKSFEFWFFKMDVKQKLQNIVKLKKR